MITLVHNTIKDLAPTQFLNRPPMNDDFAISYHFFNEKYGLYGDGKGKIESASLQIDVFSKSDYTEKVKEIKTRLIAKGFKFFDGYDLDDEIGKMKLYHKILLFNFAESEVKK